MTAEYLVLIATLLVLLVCVIIVIRSYCRNEKRGVEFYVSILGLVLGPIFCVISSQNILDTLKDLPSNFAENFEIVFSVDYIDENIATDHTEQSTGEMTFDIEGVPNDDVTDWVVKNRKDVIFKDDIFVVQMFVRKAGTKEWKKSIEAEIGDIIEFQAEYRNTTGDPNAIMVRSILPDNMDYIEDSTILYNSEVPDGTTILDNTICTSGINIGTNYQHYANAYVRFRTVINDKTLAEGLTQLVTWITITSNGEALYDEANVYVQKESE